MLERLPPTWDSKKLGDLSEIISGKSYPSSEYVKNGVSLYRISNIGQKDLDKNVKYLPEKYLDNVSSKKILELGDLTIAMSGATTGKINKVKTAFSPSLLNQRVGKIEPKLVNKEYLYHYLNTDEFQNLVLISATGAAQDNIGKSDLKRFRIPVPPVDEQRRIASVLYSVDEQVRSLHDRHDELTRVKHGLMQDLLTGSRRVNKEAEVTEEIIESGTPVETPENTEEHKRKNRDFKKRGDFARPKWSGMTKPNGWTRLNIGKNTDVQGGYAFSSDMFGEKYRSEGQPLIKRGSVNDERYPDQFTIEKFDNKYSVSEYDILVSMDGNFNSQIWRFETKGALNQRVCMLRTNDSLNTYYLYYLLKPLLRHTEISLGATTVKSLSINDFDHMNPAVPPLWEQERIASILYTVDKIIDRTSDLINEYEQIKRGLMQDLLSGDIRTPENLEVLEFGDNQNK